MKKSNAPQVTTTNGSPSAPKLRNESFERLWNSILELQDRGFKANLTPDEKMVFPNMLADLKQVYMGAEDMAEMVENLSRYVFDQSVLARLVFDRALKDGENWAELEHGLSAVHAGLVQLSGQILDTAHCIRKGERIPSWSAEGYCEL